MIRTIWLLAWLAACLLATPAMHAQELIEPNVAETWQPAPAPIGPWWLSDNRSSFAESDAPNANRSAKNRVVESRPSVEQINWIDEGPTSNPPLESTFDASETVDSVHLLQASHSDSCDGCDDLLGLRKSAWQMGGWLQQGFTFNPDDPANGSNAPVLFNDNANDYQLNQMYVYAEKAVDPNAGTWDLGGRLDVNYGTDSRFVTVPGLERETDRSRRWNSETSDYGVSLPQAYVELGTPIGPEGSSIRAGHFYAMSGYESFAAPENFFYSHAYSFLYGQPFTHTGVMWSGKVTPTSAVSLAATTGWDAFLDSGDQWGIRYAFMKRLNDGRTTFSLTGHSGDDYTGVRDTSGDRTDARNWVSVLLKHQLTERFYYVVEGDYGRQDNSVVVLDNTNNTIGFSDASWYGINQYWVYQMNSQWSSGLRAEWFRDDGNSRLGLPVEYANGGPAFDGGDYFAITGGLNYKPHSNVVLRSELRWDYSDVESNPNIPAGVAGIRPFNDRSDDNQFLIGLDAIVSF